MATKRNRSSGSETDSETKKKQNLQVTPVKVNMADSQEDIDFIPQDSDSNREKAIQAVKDNALPWFGAVFDFILKDLSIISSHTKEVASCKEECRQQRLKIETLNKRVADLETKNQTLEDHISKLEDYSRKNNLLIKGIPETGPNEKVMDIVLHFFMDSLKMQNTNVRISAVHRIGKPPHLNPTSLKKPRDIIVRFESISDRDLVWKNRFQLKNSPLILCEDFCNATEEKRKLMKPFFQAARRHPKVKKCFLNRDLLNINGTSYTADKMHSLPYGLKDVNLSEKSLNDGGTAFYGKSSFLSNFHPSPIHDGGNNFPTVEHLYQYKKAVFFQDNHTALEILHAKTPNKAKALSYRINDFVAELWQPMAVQTLYKACALKFQQNPDLAKKTQRHKRNVS